MIATLSAGEHHAWSLFLYRAVRRLRNMYSHQRSRTYVTEYDAGPAAAACRVPVAYIGAEVAMADLPRFRTLCPQLITAQTLGSGHFSTLEVPEQVNAMLARLLETCGTAPRALAVVADSAGVSLLNLTRRCSRNCREWILHGPVFQTLCRCYDTQSKHGRRKDPLP